jgi:hypothetical protein
MASFLKSVVYFFIFTMGLILALNLAIDNPYSHKLVSAIVTKSISPDKKIGFSYQAIKLQAIPLQLDLFGVEISLLEPEKIQIFHSSQIRLQASLWSLLMGKFYVKHIEITHPSVYLPEGVFAQFPKQNPSTMSLADQLAHIPVGKITLYDGNLLSQVPSPINVDKIPNTKLETRIQGFTAQWNQKNHLHSLSWDIQSITIKENTRFLSDKASFSGKLWGNPNSEIHLDRWEIKSQPLNLESQGTMKMVDKRWTIDKKLTLRGDLSVLGAFLNIPNTKGPIEGDFRLLSHIGEGEPTLDIKGKAKVQGGIIDQFLLYNVDTDVEIDLEKIQFHKGQLFVDSKKIAELHGSIGFSPETPFDFRGRLTQMPLSKLLKAVQSDFDLVDLPLNTEDTHVYGQGEPFFLKAIAKASFPELWLPKYEKKTSYPCRGYLNLSINEAKYLSFQKTAFACTPGYLELAGGLDLKNDITHMKVTGKDLPLDLLTRLTPIPIKLTGRTLALAQLEGPFQNVKTDVGFETNGTGLEEWNLEGLKGKLSVTQDLLSWKDLKGKTISSPKGQWNYKTDDYSMTFDIQNLPYSKDKNTFLIQHLDGSLDGNIQSFLKSHGEVNFSFGDITQSNQTVLSSLQGSFKRTPKELTLKNLLLTKDAFSYLGHLQIQTKISPASFSPALGLSEEDRVRFSMEPKDRAHNNLGDLPFIGETLKNLSLDGLLDTKLSLGGTLKKIEGELLGSVENFTRSKKQISPMRIRGVFTKTDWEFFASFAGQTFELRSRISPFKDKIPYKLWFNGTNASVGQFFSELFVKDPRNYAYITGKIALEGNLEDWTRSTSGTVTLEHLPIRYTQEGDLKKILIVNKDPISFSIQKGHISSGKPFVFASKGLETQVLISPSSTLDNLEVVASSRVDLGILPKLVPIIETGLGTILLKTTIKGPITDLSLKVQANHGERDPPISLGLKDVSPAFQHILFDLVFENGVLSVQSFDAKKGTGFLKASGDFNLSGSDQKESNLFVSFKEARVFFPVPYLKILDTNLTGDLHITGTRPPYRIQGEVTINRAYSSHPFDLQKEVIKNFQESRSHQKTQLGLTPFWVWDLGIKAQESIIINNQSLKLYLSSQLKLQGIAPTLLGSISIDRGKFRFQQEFQVQKGNILFEPSVYMDPKLDIYSTSQVGRYHVALIIQGKTSNPEINILVDPSTKEDGTPISKLEALVLIYQGSMPESKEDKDSSKGVWVNSLVNLIDIQELTGQNDMFHIYPDATTSSEGQTILRANARVRLIDRVTGTVTFAGDSGKKFSLEVPIHDGIKASLGLTFAGSTSEEKENKDLNLMFQFPFNG